MIKINRKVEYALMCLNYLKDQQELSKGNAREISERFAIPFDTTSKVLQLLAQKGILESVQGVHGGYKLVGDLKLISYLDLAQVIEKKNFEAPCDQGCNLIENCNITKPIRNLNASMLQLFKETTLDKLLS